MSISELVSFIIPTSIAPWHPSTDIIDKAVESCWEMFGEEIQPIIICDFASDRFMGPSRDKYTKYVTRLCRKYPQVIWHHKFVGLVGAINTMMKLEVNRIVYVHQDDWEVVKPKRVDIDGLIDLMLGRQDVNYVRFSKRKLKRTWEDRHFDAPKIRLQRDTEPPLIAINDWSDHPHFATREHYRDFVLPALKDNSDKWGRKGVENLVAASFIRDQNRLGFDEANKIWGCHIYGAFGDRKYIKHLGLERKHYRQNKLGVNIETFPKLDIRKG